MVLVFTAVVKSGRSAVVTIGDNNGVFDNNGSNLFSFAMRK
jgi:hypothetical protein